MSSRDSRRYWDALAATYQEDTRISCEGFHLGPLLPEARQFGLLPDAIPGLRALELGCGAGQNSVFLARCGACCTAVDISASQLRLACGFASRYEVPLRLIQADLDRLPFPPVPTFDFIHSVWALPMTRNPAGVLQLASSLLRPGGRLLLSTAHPLFFGEWLDLDGEKGIFLPDYFQPPPDRRMMEDEEPVCVEARAVPLSRIFHWLREGGLDVVDFREPRPLPIPDMTHADVIRLCPYDSPAWRDLYPQLSRLPFVAVFLACKPT